MKIETQTLEDHQMKVTVEVEPEKLEEARQRAARNLAKKVKIPGFRPGKAPYHIIVRQLGEGAIMEEAMELLVNDIYPQMIDEAGIKPYGPGSLENIVSTEPPVFEFTVPLQPIVELGEYQEVRQDYAVPEIGETEIEGVVKNLRERQAIIEPVERSVQEGDLVTVKLSGKRLNPEEGEPETLVHERSMPVLVRAADETVGDEESVQAEWPYPGFSRSLIGLNVGDEKNVTYTFPEDYEYDSLRNSQAEFHYVVEEVKARTLPEVNDEFAVSMGEYTNMDELREDIRHHLEHQAADEYHRTYDAQVLDALKEKAVVKYPPQMLEAEIDSVIHNLEHRLEEQNMDMELYLKTRGIEQDALREEMRSVAEERLVRSLLLMQLADQEKVEVPEHEMQREFIETLTQMSQSLSDQEMRRVRQENVMRNILENIHGDLMTRKSLERIRQIASDGKFAPHVHEAPAQDFVFEEMGGEAGTAEAGEAVATEETEAPAADSAEAQAPVVPEPDAADE